MRFGVKAEPKAAVVILSRPDGKPIEAGSRGRLEGAAEQFTVGYDGRAYIKGLGASNQVAVKYSGGECHASFEYEPKKNTQVVIGPVVCQ